MTASAAKISKKVDPSSSNIGTHSTTPKAYMRLESERASKSSRIGMEAVAMLRNRVCVLVGPPLAALLRRRSRKIWRGLLLPLLRTSFTIFARPREVVAKSR